MDTRRAVSAITSLFVVVFLFAGCGKEEDGYVTHGKVYMDKLVTLDSLFHNWKEFKGKVVTIQVGHVDKFGMAITETRPIEGIDCERAIQWPLNINGLVTTEDYVEYAKGKIDTSSPSYSFYFGTFLLRFLDCKTGIQKLPEWIEYDGRIWADYKEFGKKLLPVLEEAVESDTKTFSGIFVDIEQKFDGVKALNTMDDMSTVVLVLTGIKYSEGSLN